MKTNVIIGRFQISSLTIGHKHFIDSVIKKRKADTLIFLLGIAPLSYTNKNPLTGEIRRKMLQSAYPGCIVKYIHDNPSDIEWSEQIDRILSKYKNPVLFGSRDSFIPHYHGRYKCIEIKELPGCSATDIRKLTGSIIYNNTKFREGIIHAVENRFPTAYPTVDIAVLKITSIGSRWNPRRLSLEADFGKTELLLGRKPGREKYCFVGGFVDPSDSCLEVAAARELSEEVPGIDTHELKYIGSRKIDDFRYRGTKDGIITSLFVTYKLAGSEKAGDDLEEVKWFDMANFDMDILTEHHHPLFEMLKKHLKL